ncbi:MAG TPA: hypothetical protein VHG30_01745 [Microvirga sp.]|nr:hypothetical protein [Microvirga sp.]
MTQDPPKDRMPQSGDSPVPTAEAGPAMSHLGQDDADDARRREKPDERPGDTGGPSAKPPRQPGGIASGLQPGGTSPGGGPGASAGSVGTGGAQTGGGASGSVKKSGV